VLRINRGRNNDVVEMDKLGTKRAEEF